MGLWHLKYRYRAVLVVGVVGSYVVLDASEWFEVRKWENSTNWALGLFFKVLLRICLKTAYVAFVDTYIFKFDI